MTKFQRQAAYGRNPYLAAAGLCDRINRESGMNPPLIFNIQKFSVHDGPGIRTTVFFKGCPMRCLWCHNPESQRALAERMEDKDGKEEEVGRRYPVAELAKLLAKDQIFYEQSGGGVTLSGGEVMAQDMEYVVSLLQSLKRVGIHTAIDTCGDVPVQNYEKVLPYADLFLYDLKLMDTQKHEKYTGVSNERVLANLKYLGSQGAAIDLRLILVKDVNVDLADIQAIADWLKGEQVGVERISLLPYHDFGRDKYRRLHRECTQNFAPPSEEAVDNIKKFLEQCGYRVQVGG